jgi:hypothetical protein
MQKRYSVFTFFVMLYENKIGFKLQKKKNLLTFT